MTADDLRSIRIPGDSFEDIKAAVLVLFSARPEVNFMAIDADGDPLEAFFARSTEPDDSEFLKPVYYLEGVGDEWEGMPFDRADDRVFAWPATKYSVYPCLDPRIAENWIDSFEIKEV